VKKLENNMQITKQEPVEKFTVSAGVNLEYDKELETLVLQDGDTQVKLNKEECQELLRVLNGKCHKFSAVENENAYQAHSVLLCSAHEKTQINTVIYSEKSIAKF
jgi:hypothetical protein